MQSYILVTRKAVWVTLARWLRRMIRLGVAALVLGIQSVPAIACSIVDMTPSDQPMRGANCSYYHIATTIRAVGLSEAVDLGGGFVIQHATDGNACYREWNIVVHDCNARSLVVVGPARDDYGPEQAEVPMYDIFNRIESDAAAGHPMSLAALTSLADSYGYAGTLRTAVGTRLSINGYNVPSDCACDTFYPGLGGG
jgi:hypothetical protein